MFLPLTEIRSPSEMKFIYKICLGFTGEKKMNHEIWPLGKFIEWEISD